MCMDDQREKCRRIRYIFDLQYIHIQKRQNLEKKKTLEYCNVHTPWKKKVIHIAKVQQNWKWAAVRWKKKLSWNVHYCPLQDWSWTVWQRFNCLRLFGVTRVILGILSQPDLLIQLFCRRQMYVKAKKVGLFGLVKRRWGMSNACVWGPATC